MTNHSVACNVLYLGPPEGCDSVARALGDRFRLVRAEPTEAGVTATIADAHVVLDASMKVRMPAELLSRAQELKLVITATTGADHIDRAHLDDRGIPLLTLKGQEHITNQLTPAAELSWMLLLACARQLRGAIRHVEGGLWDRERFPGKMLKGRTIGVVGCGRIGKWVARYANAFDMRTIGHDPFNKEWPPYLESVSLEGLLDAADCISLHLHLSPETRHIIGAAELKRVKRGVIMVNTSRGALIDERALLAALEDGTVGAYGCDVLEDEPAIDRSALWKYAATHDNCLITPHIGGFSPDALATVLRFTAQRIEKFICG